ncbi:putative caspase recruitment domain protein [short-finned eel virus]|uniref:Putative caspase recruitment domain protein n=1 Tax=short-finned eel virus TaxID=2848076 RepID=A0A192GNZ1_FRG3V|nr:putative caspase recruitment domain protein [Short-finned eel ranavirus]ANK58102.1 putative caspase recruitment domain protein [Short-finned eel ranavirus]
MQTFGAQEMGKGRRAFIRLSKLETLKNLIDEMLAERVFNEGQAADILESNDTRADIARALIDSVTKKGDVACSLMAGAIAWQDVVLAGAMGISQV